MNIFSSTKVERGARGVTFTVDNVQPTYMPLPENTLDSVFTHRTGREVQYMPERGRSAVLPRLESQAYEVDRKRSFDEIVRGSVEGRVPQGKPAHVCVHPLVEAVHLAFSDHRPLMLSPDAIWLVFAQGFSHHIFGEADRLRLRLVSHSGRRTLRYSTNALNDETWAQAISSFSQQIREASDQVLHETLICDYSTTTPEIRTASELVLMDTYKRLFEYEIQCICGIPKITLSGTVEDWRRIRERIEVLATYELEWWVSRLRPILDEFVRSAEGKPDREFWKAIYKPEAAYGTKEATGWIVDLFPYIGDEPERRRNPLFNRGEDWKARVSSAADRGAISIGGLPPSVFPSGLSQVPVKLTGSGNTEGTQIGLMGGFLSVGQDRTDNTVYPIIGWALASQ